MELNNVIENLKQSLKAKQEDFEFYSSKVKQTEAEIYKTLGALELADILSKDAEKNNANKETIPAEELTEPKE